MFFRPLLLALLSSTSHAWVSRTAFPMSRTARFATVEPAVSASTAASSGAVELEPPYQAALDASLAKLQQGLVDNPAKDQMLPLLSHFVKEYLAASQCALKAGGDPAVNAPDVSAKRFMQAIHFGSTYGMGKDKYVFDVSHKALRGDAEQEDGNEIDFYKFGCDFFRPAMDLENSPILGLDNLDQALAQMKAGENVVFFANHQSEADPQVVSCCLEKIGQAKTAEDMIYVAGHKVTTDPLAIPFSMGRNLICIHSKKHIDADPTTKPAKQKQNLRSMNALLNTFKAGGAAIWVAPSGGRDRRNVETGEVPLAPFDSKTIDIFRLMGNKSKVPTHYYTLAMVSYDLCPPPDFVEAGVGEERNVRFVPVGIYVGKELESKGGLESRHEFCENAMKQCTEDYETLLEEISKNLSSKE